ncbi:cytochrome b562 [Vibrio viridaestus]|nr:cytochrome b562 [Vibrio viridaestus]
MKRALLLIGAVLLSTNAFADSHGHDDLEKLMKGFKTEFKAAADAKSVDEMKSAIMKFDHLVAEAKKGDYPAKEAPTFEQGFDKLAAALDKVEMSLDKGDLKQAKEDMRSVDDVRKEFHKKLK